MRASWIALGGVLLGGGLLGSAAAQNAADPPVEITTTVSGIEVCLNSPAQGPAVALLTCEPNDTRQRWDLVRSSPTAANMKLRLNGTQSCLTAEGGTNFVLRGCSETAPGMEWSLTRDRALMSVSNGQCLQASARPITLGDCKDVAIDKWTTRSVVIARPAALGGDSRGRFTLNEIRNGDRCLSNFQDPATGTYRARFEACTVPTRIQPINYNQQWVYSERAGSDIASTRDRRGRIINAQTGGCLDFDGRSVVMQQCDNGRESQVFRPYFRSLEADVTVNNQREKICLMVGPDGALASRFASRRQCDPLSIWNNDTFKFASTAIAFTDWSPPPPPPPPPTGTVKSIEWVRVTPKVPASGIDDEVYQAIAVAEWAMVVREGPLEVAKTVAQDIVMSEVENQLGPLPQGLRSPARVVNWLLNDATSPAYVLGRLDEAFSSSDDLYVKINQYVVWPEYIDDMNALARRGSTPHAPRRSGETVNLYPSSPSYRIDLLPGESASFSAWEWDSGSDNDLLAEVTLSYNIAVGTHRYLLMSREEHSVYEFEFNVVERPYWSCSGNIRHCTYEAPPVPRWPQ